MNRAKHDPGYRPKSPTCPNDPIKSGPESDKSADGAILFYVIVSLLFLAIMLNR